MQDAIPSDWINGDLFLEYLKHFIRHTRCSKEKKVLLILNIHESHISLAVINLAKGNRLLTMPPHTSHKLQSLDACCMTGLKTLPSNSRRGLHQELAAKAIRHSCSISFVALKLCSSSISVHVFHCCGQRFWCLRLTVHQLRHGFPVFCRTSQHINGQVVPISCKIIEY